MTQNAILSAYEEKGGREISSTKENPFKVKKYFRNDNSSIIGTLIISPKPGRYQIDPELSFGLIS
jgi:hypothetical protein